MAYRYLLVTAKKQTHITFSNFDIAILFLQLMAILSLFVVDCFPELQFTKMYLKINDTVLRT